MKKKNPMKTVRRTTLLKGGNPRMKNKIAALILCFMLALSTASIIGATQTHGRPSLGTIYVDDDNTGGPWDGTMEHPYQYIQDAINVAVSGDTVYVFNGIYSEALTILTPLTLTGESANGVIVDGASAFYVIAISANNVQINTLTVQNGVIGIHNENAGDTTVTACRFTALACGVGFNSIITATITDCEFFDLTGSGVNFAASTHITCQSSSFNRMQNGVYCSSSSDALIQDCIFDNLTYVDQYNCGSAVYVEYSNNATIVDCQISNCSEYGVYYFFATNGLIEGCQFTDNTWNPDAQYPSYYHSVGIDIAYTTGCTIANCTFTDNDNGVLIGGGSPNLVMRDNAFSGNREGSLDVQGYELAEFNLDIDTSNTIDGAPILYLTNQQDLTLNASTGASYLALVNCTNITATDFTVQGILIAYTTDVTLQNIVSHHSKTGFFFFQTNAINVLNCEAYNTSTGFSGAPNEVYACTAHDNNYGFNLNAQVDAGGNVTNCIAFDNNIGFYEAKGSTITNCQAYHNAQTGFIIGCSDPSIGSVMRDNQFYDNTYNFATEGWSGPGGYLSHDVDTSNLVDGRPIYYITDQHNTVIDGANNPIGTLILIACNNVTVKNVNLTNNVQGVLLISTLNSKFINCTFMHNSYGVRLYSTSNHNTFTDCTSSYNEWGIANQEWSSYNTISNCQMNNNSRFGYWSQVSDANILRNCIIHGNGYIYPEQGGQYPGELQNGGPGIMIHYQTPNNIIENCSVADNYEGIYIFWDCNNQIIRNCTFDDNKNNGIGIRYSQNISIDRCSASGNKYGYGITEDSGTVRITNSAAHDNEYGIYVDASYGNTFYHNNIYNNTQNAFDSASNTWDNGVTDGGNYWDDYTGTDADGDGIGDTPYDIPGSLSKDNYPFMDLNGWIDDQPPVVEISKPGKALYFKDKLICSFPATVIIKSITITINTTDDTGVDHVEVLIDGISKINLTNQPYTYLWEDRTPLKFRHDIKVIAYDDAGNNAEETMQVWKFL